MSRFFTWGGGDSRQRAARPPTGPEATALATSLEAQLAEVQASGGPLGASARLRQQIAAIERHERERRATSRPGPRLPNYPGSRAPMPPTPGMRTTRVTPSGEERG